MTELRGPQDLPGGGEGPAARELAGDVCVVRAMYGALDQGDDGNLAGWADPGIGWVDPLSAVLPFDGLRRGWPSVLRSAFRRDPSGKGPRVSPETFLEFGDGVLVVGRFLWAGRKADEPFVHECFVRGGKVALIREYRAL
ncbi:hypothetical protein GBA65_02520 [Rubrobacter marinus]|uniref:SnoaL-like domain-containing protein n=1 Tax=Rubrobacter marinus TaxID=2653852 RepID=A0A6G8PUA9_9ACTN|nr:hypothetical protein [Rubrobacter marinus]QIN77566.1 hypothetical protein GBA65_02520 [Rubrobacter marinus]